MGSQDLPVDDPHQGSSLLEFRIENTGDGLLVSVRIDSRAADSEALINEILSQIKTLTFEVEHLLAERSTVSYRHKLLMNREPEHVSEKPKVATENEPDTDVFGSEDLIPEAPARPSGKIAVVLKKVGRDQPLPAENPWAE